MQQIADTGFLVAYWSRNDQHHAWARSLAVRPPLITCAPVLTEASYLLGREEPLLQMLEDGDMASTFDLDANASRLMQWLDKYADACPWFDRCVRGQAGRDESARGDSHDGSSRFLDVSHAGWQAIEVCVPAR